MLAFVVEFTEAGADAVSAGSCSSSRTLESWAMSICLMRALSAAAWASRRSVASVSVAGERGFEEGGAVGAEDPGAEELGGGLVQAGLGDLDGAGWSGWAAWRGLAGSRGHR